MEISPDSAPRFATLLYRYVFFDWLFADSGLARTPFERRAAWLHNRAMRRYLPIYLRRWSAISGVSFSLGCVFERLFQIFMAAFFFTGCAMAVTGIAHICMLWLLLSRPREF